MLIDCCDDRSEGNIVKKLFVCLFVLDSWIEKMDSSNQSKEESKKRDMNQSIYLSV